MYKTNHFQQLLPHAIVPLFKICHLNAPTNSTSSNSDTPVLSDTHIMSERLTTLGNSLFIKGPCLHEELTIEAAEAKKPFLAYTLNSYKNSITAYLIDMQSNGSSTEWIPDNFRLCVTKATRKSPRLNPMDN